MKVINLVHTVIRYLLDAELYLIEREIDTISDAVLKGTRINQALKKKMDELGAERLKVMQAFRNFNNF